MIKITKGDAVTLNFTAKLSPTEPLDLTGATFSTQMMGPGGKNITFATDKHAIVDADAGEFSLTLSAADTATLEASSEEQIKNVVGREIKTTITQSSRPFTVRADILIVYPANVRS